MKKVGFLIIGLLLLAAVAASGCIAGETETSPTSTARGGPPEDRGQGSSSGELGMPDISVLPYQELSEDEIDAILYMAEEEKLARDVYLTLFNETGVQVFDNIARSEQTHMDMVVELIEKYNLTNPIEGLGVGEFRSKEMQNLYDDLVSKGSVGEVEALKVGALVEEIDIKDLQEYLRRTDNEDVKAVFESLMSGSKSHLRAFTGVLSNRYGVAYSPQVLSGDEYQAIVG
ncbi:hypothetical protein APY94_05125 [Thermococcus celericrescens]|uniref:DUF2202 domain-containing protein n=1 Tax=Thermococcus celericrescens TaxID=227598 RepID=A0A100XY71_9EURY|nr:DUF2202 domain-containing protein [Thermococcus celericrescens]KUH33579.1 hypothetical protein APY94_05125 [Thermococcus celericrescens]